MSAHPTFPGGDPNKPWDKQPWDKAKPQEDEQQSEGVLGVAGDVVGETAGAVVEGVGAVAEGAAGCLDGCGSCSLAVLLMLFAAGGTARAAFELFK